MTEAAGTLTEAAHAAGREAIINILGALTGSHDPLTRHIAQYYGEALNILADAVADYLGECQGYTQLKIRTPMAAEKLHPFIGGCFVEEHQAIGLGWVAQFAMAYESAIGQMLQLQQKERIAMLLQTPRSVHAANDEESLVEHLPHAAAVHSCVASERR